MAGSLRHLVIVLVSLQIPCLCAGLTCLKCTGISIPRSCGKTQTCEAHQICFIEKTSSSAGNTYNMGCRDGHLCTTQGRRSASAFMTSLDTEPVRNNSSNDVILRLSRSSICDTCCTSDLCNSGGCGATGYLTRHSRGPVCYSCAQRSTPQSCDTVTICGKNSVCRVKLVSHPQTGDVYYSSTCEDAQVCHQDVVFTNSIVGRKRLTEEVDTATHKCIEKCCDADLCNGQCGTGSAIPGTTSSACTPDPCIHGTCSLSQGTYVCTCNSGATGRNCDTLPNYCASSPCLHGTCHNQGTSYQCHCNTGYSGTNCDIAPNACSPSPCQHGTCHNQGTRYYCTCNSGYTGQNCDHPPNACLFRRPCIHGYCHQSGASYTCACSPGYTGINCDYRITGGSHGRCANGWLRHGYSCYLVQKHKATWAQAKWFCQGQGAYLAEVGDTSEESFLVQVGPVAHKGDWWLGGIKHGTTWKWDHSGRALGSGSWGSQRPTNNSFYCLEIKKTSHAWNNEDCNHPNYYICEK